MVALFEDWDAKEEKLGAYVRLNRNENPTHTTSSIYCLVYIMRRTHKC